MATEQTPPPSEADEKPVTHAHAIDTAPPDDGHAGTPSVADRVTHIVGMMARLEWSRGRSAGPLAEQWGLSLNTVEKHAAEASRIVKADLDKDEIGRDVGVIAREALLAAKAVNDFKGIKAMADVLLDISGARAPTKVENKITGVTLDDIDDLKKTALANECPEETENEPSS
jgi:hypothetical protein